MDNSESRVANLIDGTSKQERTLKDKEEKIKEKLEACQSDIELLEVIKAIASTKFRKYCDYAYINCLGNIKHNGIQRFISLLAPTEYIHTEIVKKTMESLTILLLMQQTIIIY